MNNRYQSRNEEEEKKKKMCRFFKNSEQKEEPWCVICRSDTLNGCAIRTSSRPGCYRIGGRHLDNWFLCDVTLIVGVPYQRTTVGSAYACHKNRKSPAAFVNVFKCPWVHVLCSAGGDSRLFLQCSSICSQPVIFTFTVSTLTHLSGRAHSHGRERV